MPLSVGSMSRNITVSCISCFSSEDRKSFCELGLHQLLLQPLKEVKVYNGFDTDG